MISKKIKLYIKLSEQLFTSMHSDTFFSVVKTMLINIHQFPDITIEQIASESNTTPASVTKVCRKLGYEGFKELRSDVKEYPSSDFLDVLSKRSNSIEDIYSSYSKNVYKENMLLFNLLDHNQLRRIAEKVFLSNNLSIISNLYGLGVSNLFCELLISFRKTVFRINRDSEYDVLETIYSNTDFVLIISLTGKWIDYQIHLNRLPILLSQKAVLITYEPSDKYSELFYEVISLHNLENFFSSTSITRNSIEELLLLIIIYLSKL